MALTDIKVRTARPTDKQYKLTDGSGMHLLVPFNGSEYQRLQYRFAGKQISLVNDFFRYNLVIIYSAKTGRNIEQL